MCQLGNDLRTKERNHEEKKVICKRVEEVFEMKLSGEHGTNGRPRVRLPMPPPSPDYELIDLHDPGDEILVQGEIARYKACINPGF